VEERFVRPLVGGVMIEGTASEPAAGATDRVRPELADLGRLGRRALRGVVRAARADQAPSLHRTLLAHLGEVPADAAVVEEIWRGYDHVNVQAGIDAWLADPGRTHVLVGIAGFQHHEFGLADLLGPAEQPPWGGPRPGNVALASLPAGPDGEVRRAVQCGIYLVSDGECRAALLLRGAEPNSPRQDTTLQIVSTDPAAAAVAGARIRQLALERNVFRGQVLSFGGEVFDPGHSLLGIQRRPVLDRSRLILPEATLAAVERQVVGVSRRRERLLTSGQHLKRGLLLYGPPGTGKTHTVRYLLSELTGSTVILLTGMALHLVAEACSVARALQPAMVVVEDVDLIAEERGMAPGEHPLLFQLLNEMDGLAEDADVVFVLTTNRPDLLEPALAARPGRVDQAVELALPDRSARRRLLELYRGDLRLDADALEDVIARTEGVTASFLKELLRRAAVIAADAEALDGGPATGDGRPVAGDGGPVARQGALRVSAAQLGAALDELLDTRNAMTRILLGTTREDGPAGYA
jgi:ATPase family associated with various cellular activities (AAA)